MEKKLSIILPVFNEKDSLPIMVRILNSSIKFQKEIIIVYDSENDNTVDVAQDLADEFEDVKLVHNNISKGVRFAVDVGVNASVSLALALTSTFALASGLARRNRR